MFEKLKFLPVKIIRNTYAGRWLKTDERLKEIERGVAIASKVGAKAEKRHARLSRRVRALEKELRTMESSRTDLEQDLAEMEEILRATNPNNLPRYRTLGEPNCRKCLIVGADEHRDDNIALLCCLGLLPIAYLPIDEDSPRPYLRIDEATVRENAEQAGLRDVLIPRRIPVVTPEEARVMVAEHSPIVFAGSTATISPARFHETAAFVQRELGSGVDLKHMNAALDLFTPRGGFHIMSGLSGSGNMIFQTTLLRLFETHGYVGAPYSPLENQIVRIGVNYMRSLANAFSERFSTLSSGGSLVPGANLLNYGKCTVRGPRGPDQRHQKFAVLAGVPFRIPLWSNPLLTSHEPFTKRTVEFYEASNIRMICILRHPLDVIVSNAGKLAGTMGGRQANILLNQVHWFHEMLQTVEAFYWHLAQNREHLSFVRYERLQSDPAGEIADLASLFGLEVSEDECLELWSALGNKPLDTTGKGHLWDPRAGKWKEFLGRWHWDQIQQTRLPELAASFGYEMAADDFSAPVEVSERPLPHMTQAEDATLHVAIGKPINHPDIVKIRDELTGALILTLKEHEAFARDLFTRVEFSTLLRAGAGLSDANSRGIAIPDILGAGEVPCKMTRPEVL